MEQISTSKTLPSICTSTTEEDNAILSPTGEASK